MKTNQITFKVAKLDDSAAKVVGIAVASDGAVAKEVGMTRDQLEALNFEGKLGQTLVLPNSKKQRNKLRKQTGSGSRERRSSAVTCNDFPAGRIHAAAWQACLFRINSNPSALPPISAVARHSAAGKILCVPCAGYLTGPDSIRLS